MTIHIASDHAGFELKESLIPFITEELGMQVTDHGAYTYDENDDYPDFIRPAIEAVTKDLGNSKAIILGGSGQGEAMVANRYKGIRATVFYGGPLEIIELSRQHNDANVLSLGARFVNHEDIKSAIKLWLDTTFTNEPRHTRRNNMIDN